MAVVLSSKVDAQLQDDDPYKLKVYQVDSIPADGGAAPLPKTAEPEAYHDNRIYVSNIPFSFKDEDLVTLFSRFGQVISAMIVCNERGSKGFGFVTMDSVNSCEKAREMLHGTRILGRVIEVRKATPLTNKPGARRGFIASCQPQSNTSSPRKVPHKKKLKGISQSIATKVMPVTDPGLLQTAQQPMPVSSATALNTMLCENQMLLQNILTSPPMQAIQAAIHPSYYCAPTMFPSSLPFLSVPVPLQQSQSGFQYRVIAPQYAENSYIVGPKGACFVRKDSAGSGSLNNTLLSSSMHAHMQGLQDNLVNMLNLDGTINHSILMDIRADHSFINASSLTNSSTDSADSGRKRRANVSDYPKKHCRL